MSRVGTKVVTDWIDLYHLCETTFAQQVDLGKDMHEIAIMTVKTRTQSDSGHLSIR
jgi:hypothetical protein